MKFLDQVKIYVKAGNGGDGSPSFRREKFIEYGGPDGGDGGKGGSIILKSEQSLNTLIDYRYQQHHKAERGENGMGQNRTGKSGEDLILKVPLGTQIFEEDNKTLIYDFIEIEEEFCYPLQILVYLEELLKLNLHHLFLFGFDQNRFLHVRLYGVVDIDNQ